MDPEQKSKEKPNEEKKKENIFDFACVIAEYKRTKIPSQPLKEINLKPYKEIRVSSTV